jgi:hypothetical protein
MRFFSRFYIKFFQETWNNIVNYFKRIGENWEVRFENWDRIGFYFSLYSQDFTPLDWIMFIVSVVFAVIFVYLSIRKIIDWLSKYIKFSATEIEKEKLLDEIRELNMKVMDVIEEKNKILSLKMSAMGGGVDPSTYKKQDDKKALPTGPPRFIKLIQVDEEFSTQDMSIMMTDEDKITLEKLCQRFRHFAASRLKLYYTEKMIQLFFASLATTKVVILEGVSGTGKTSLPYAIGKFFKSNAAMVSVQPSWRDRGELLGYLNEFTKKFNETEFLKAVYAATFRKDINLIVLDEMNLARIEYYFAEFLSVMEMPDDSEWKIDLVPNPQDNDPVNIVDGKLLVPQNLWFIGTANKDDSTFTITDKVYDRAIALEFFNKGEYFDSIESDPISFSYEFLDQLFQKAHLENKLSQKTVEKFAKLDVYLMDNFRLAFGNRIIKQITDFVPVFVACGGNELDALDYLLAHKILRKFEALNIAFMREELKNLVLEIDKLFGKNAFSESKKYLAKLQRI